MLPTTIHNTSIVPTSNENSSSSTMTIELWSVTDVYNWSIQARQGIHYADILRDNFIDGRALINLTYEDIVNMKIPVGPARNLFKDIEDLKSNLRVFWAYSKVSDTINLVQSYLPMEHLSKAKDYSIEGFSIVKGYSIIGYNKVIEYIPPNTLSTVTNGLVKVGSYIPVVINKIRGNNTLFPDRVPLLLESANNNNNNNNNTETTTTTTTPGFEQPQLFNVPPPTYSSSSTTITENYTNQQQQQQTTVNTNEIPMYSSHEHFQQSQQQQQQQSQQPEPFSFEQQLPESIELPQPITSTEQVQPETEEFSFDQQTVGDFNNNNNQEENNETF
ncbi:hypothetical protein ACTFIR_009262 [Dictyostelium discoideum]